MPDRKTIFNANWTDNRPWLEAVEKDNTKARCNLCNKTFSVAGKGIGCINEHGGSKMHQDAEKSAASSHSIQRFFSRKFAFIFCVRLHLKWN